MPHLRKGKATEYWPGFDKPGQLDMYICPLISPNEMVNNCHPLVLNEIDVADHGVPFGLIVAYRIIGVTGVREMYVTQ